jgi:O-antigen ligase
MAPHLPRLLFFLLWALVLALNSAKAILSISWVALAALTYAQAAFARRGDSLPGWRDRYWWPAWLLMGLWFMALLSGWITEDSHRWARDLRTKSPLLLLPVALLLLPPLAARWRRFFALSFIYAQAVWALLTLVGLALDYEAQLRRVAQNGNIDVPGSISHIYLGLLLAFAVLMSLYLWLHARQAWRRPQRSLLVAAALLCFITLHVLNSRTAQLSLYAGLFALLGRESWQRKAYRSGAAALLLLLATPVLAYVTLPSFRTRVAVTRWDYQQFEQGTGQLANNSLSIRLAGWRAAWETFLDHPWLGVGLEDLGQEMVQRYQAWGLDLPDPLPPRLKIPHNQYLKYLGGVGLGGLAWLLLLLIYPWFHPYAPRSSLLLGFLAMMAVALLAENFLERQIGILFFCLGYILLQKPANALSTEAPSINKGNRGSPC